MRLSHCYGFSCVPPETHVEILSPSPLNMTLCKGRFITAIISKDEVILESGGPLIQYDRCPFGQ